MAVLRWMRGMFGGHTTRVEGLVMDDDDYGKSVHLVISQMYTCLGVLALCHSKG